MMTAEQLKGAILQLAVQGNLVEQRTSEREVVFKKGKSKETEELDFEIPMTWITAHLETVVDSVASKQYQIKESEVKPEGEYRVISQSKEYSIGYCNDKSKLYHHEQPVIVFGDHTTEVKFIDFDFIVGADGIKIFNPNIDIIEPRFLFYQLQFYARGLNKVGGYSRHYKFIKNKPIVIPPLAEQKRIVEKIEELMPFVEQYATASTKLNTLNTSFPEMMKKSILQEAVQGKLVPQDPNDEPASLLLKKIAEEKKRLFKEGKIKKQKPLPEITEDEIPFDIPENWEWVRLGDLISIKSGEGLTSSNMKEGTIPVYGGNGITGFHNKALVHEETVVIGRVGYYCGSVHVTEPEAWVTDNAFITTYPKECVNREYLVFVLRYLDLGKDNNATAQPVVSGKKIYPKLFPLPPLDEQKRIANKIEKLLPLVEELVH